MRVRGYRIASDFRDPESYHRYLAMSVELSKPKPAPWDRPPRDEAERLESMRILDELLTSWGKAHAGGGEWRTI